MATTRRLSLGWLLACLLALVIWPGSILAQEPPSPGQVDAAQAADEPLEVIEVRAESFPRVVVRLNARSADGTSLPDLAPEQIRVVENGRPQPTVDLFQIRGTQTRASLVLAIDVSGSMAEQDRLVQAREAAKAFLTQTRAGDRVALLSFADDVTLRQGLTADRRTLGQAIDTLQPLGDTRLFDALSRSVGYVATSPTGTRAVVLLTDGHDTSSTSDVADGIALAARAGVAVYTIGLGSEVQVDVLQRIADETGGRFYRAPTSQDLAQAFKLISQQLATQYEIYWVSRQQPSAGAEVPVELTVNSPGLPAVTTRFTYKMPNFSLSLETPLNLGGDLAAVPEVPPPSPDQVLLAGLLSSLTVGLLYTGLVLPRARRRIEARLATYLGGRPPTPMDAVFSTTPRLSSRRVELSPLAAASSRLAARLLPQRQLWRLRRMMTQAGLPTERHLRLFLALELALALLLGAGGYLLLRLRQADSHSPLLTMLMLGALVVLGFYLPYVWLRRRIANRRKELLRNLPDALDLMAIGVSAGLSVDGAMLEVVQKWEGELSRELTQVLNEMRMGLSRRQALLNLVERVQLEDFRLLVAALIQAEELGTNVSETLTIQAEQLRIRRRQQAEEQARKAPVKMLGPLVFMIFPALFVVILGPAALQIFRTLRAINSGI